MTADLLDNLSFKQMRILFPELARACERRLVETYDEFVDLLLGDIDDGLRALERNPELRQKDSEDRLTIELVNFLRARSYNATHESKHGGKVDILVEHLDRGFTWLGEAKIHSSYEYLFQGFQQLCTRYSQGTPDSNRGGLIAYVFGKNCGAVMELWKERLPGFSEQKLEFSPCSTSRAPFSFITTHLHPSSGLPYTVRHMGVVLHFTPKDKSAARRAPRKAAKKASASTPDVRKSSVT